MKWIRNLALIAAVAAPLAASAASPASQYDDTSYPETTRATATVASAGGLANAFDDAGLRGAGAESAGDARVAGAPRCGCCA